MKKDKLILVGIGASAGGLKPLQALIANLPKEIDNVSFVIAQHVSPNYKSMLVELIGRETSLEVKEVEDGMRIVPRTVYITPPDNDITVGEDTLHLNTPNKVGPKPSVDRLFGSIAQVFGENSVAIILSGTGQDGAKGLRTIKEKGGITLVQNPSTAKYDGMPQASLNTGQVALSLQANEIGRDLMDILKDMDTYKSENIIEERVQTDVGEILQLLSQRVGIDIQGYKTSTIYRRLEKRLNEKNFVEIDKYLQFVKENPEELDALFDSILIGVTRFFRDIEAFGELNGVLETILREKQHGENVRVWVPGCATGEEAYSIAILFDRLLKEAGQQLNIQIFATDIDPKALKKARKGIYKAAAVEELPDDMLEHYFIENEQGDFELSAAIRRMVLFSKHDIISNPPFLKLDLISCRNLLIYFTQELQERIFPVFHFALNSTGILFLGKSESIGNFGRLFNAKPYKHKIYSKKLGESKVVKFPYLRVKPTKYGGSGQKHSSEQKKFTINEMLKETIYNTYEHPYIVIDENFDLVKIHGDVDRFVSLKQGIVTTNVLKLIHKDLQVELRSIMGSALRKGRMVRGNLRRMEITDEEVDFVRLMVKPVIFSQKDSSLFAVIFEMINLDKTYLSLSSESSETPENPRLIELEHELEATKEHMNTLVEELETSNEELQSLNEEMQSSNEELQASNEELETANEELQSSNEELEIAYDEIGISKQEIEQQNDRIRQSENNLMTLLNNTLQAFVLLNKNYTIVTFNKTANDICEKVFGKKLEEGGSFIDFIPPEIFEDFKDNFHRALMGELVGDNIIMEREDSRDNVYLDCNFTPVKQEDTQNISAISLSFIDKTIQKVDALGKERIIENLKSENNHLQTQSSDREKEIKGWVDSFGQAVINLKLNIEAMKKSEHTSKSDIQCMEDSLQKLMKVAKQLATATAYFSETSPVG